MALHIVLSKRGCKAASGAENRTLHPRALLADLLSKPQPAPADPAAMASSAFANFTVYTKGKSRLQMRCRFRQERFVAAVYS